MDYHRFNLKSKEVLKDSTQSKVELISVILKMKLCTKATSKILILKPHQTYNYQD